MATPPPRAPLTITAPSADRIRQHARQKVKRPIILRRGDLVVGDRIGDAIFEGFNRTHSLFWHKQRSTGIGGSDVSALVGVSKYSSAFKMWCERTGRVQRKDDGKNAAAKLWGQKLEKVILEVFAQKHPELMILTWSEGWGASFRSSIHDYQLASPDALSFDPITHEWGLVEVKTSRYDDEWKDAVLFIPAVPEYYKTQDQWYLDVFGWKDSHFAVLFAGSEYTELAVQADTFEQGANRARVEHFLALVADDLPPDWDGSDVTYELVRQMNPDIDRTLDPLDLGALGDALVLELRVLAAADAAVKAKKSEVMDTMGKHQYGTVNGAKILAREAKKSDSTPSGYTTPYIKMKVK